ncbi:hypothetical protein MYXO_01145 [Myxococcaceae bacterium]|jgi:hypothetical protein|nr:hypothetical protein MYXO_01145 [Myxococcaceae bacterium]
MKKARARRADDLRPEYDLSQLTGRVKAKHLESARSGTNLVLLEPDVAKAFPDASSVNEALRLLVAVASRKSGRSRRSPRKRA